MTFAQSLHAAGEFGSVVLGRLRASKLRMLGASLGSAARIGKRVVVDRPWCLEAGERTVFEHGVYIKAVETGTVISLGREVFVGFNSEFDISQGLFIGDHVLIAPGCFITDHGHRHEAGRLIADQGCSSDPVRIEDDVWLGAKVVVLPGISIGKGAVVAAGAIVTRNVASMDIVAGIPARVIGVRK